MQILPEKSKRAGVGNSRFLLVRTASHYLVLRSDKMEDERIYSGDTIEIAGMGEIEIHNPHPVPVDVEYQLTQREITQSTGGEMTVTSDVNIREVKSVIHTQAQTNRGFIAPLWVDIQPQQKRKIASANTERRELLIQNVSASEMQGHIGDVNIGDKAGLLLGGQVAAPGFMGLETSADVYAYNPSTDAVLTLSLAEVSK